MHSIVDVCLVEVPFSSYGNPILSLSLLKAVLLRESISAKVIYGNMMMAETTDPRTYAILNGKVPQSSLVTELIFTPAAHGGSYNDYLEPYREALKQYSADQYPKEVLDALFSYSAAAAEFIPDFLNRLADRILALSPRIVGMSSMFHQNNACFALAKILKQRDPKIITIMGSANCTAESGAAICRTVPDIDCVFSGEADECFGELCRLLMEYGPEVPTGRLPYGAMTKKLIALYDEKGIREYPVRRTKDMDSMPYPDFADYFEQIEEYGLRPYAHPVLMAEFSRGCWWHDKKPCSFCGLNSAENSYRTKSPQRCLAELKYLTETYGINRIELTDNILSPIHFREVLPVLAAERAAGISEYYFLAEVKSNLKADEIQLLADAGFCVIQPGIENLQDDILTEMNKGNRGIKHVEFLRRCREAGLIPIWHILGGFPLEKESSYEELAEIITLITHLPAPKHYMHISYTRYSTYWNDPEAYGLDLVTLPVYSVLFPLGQDFVDSIAYVYQGRDPYDQPWRVNLSLKSPAHKKVGDLTSRWTISYDTARDRLEYRQSPGTDVIDITDLRACAKENFYSLSGLSTKIFLECRSVIRRSALEEKLAVEGYATAQVNDTLTELIDRYKVVIQIRGELLTVALPENCPDNLNRRNAPAGVIYPHKIEEQRL